MMLWVERVSSFFFFSSCHFIYLFRQRRRWRDSIKITGAREHNLKDVDVTVPLGVMTVVTGVSGSGKSTLVRDILYRAVNRRLGNAGEAPAFHRDLTGDLSRIKDIQFVATSASTSSCIS